MPFHGRHISQTSIPRYGGPYPHSTGLSHIGPQCSNWSTISSWSATIWSIPRNRQALETRFGCALSSAAPSIAALLPCNVVVREAGDRVVVEAIDPDAMSLLEDRPEIAEVATEARARLRAALDRIVPQEA